MKIFIIGGAGYIGSHMVKIAHKAGHNVVTLDNLSTGHQDAVLYGEFELCDILDTAKLDKLFKILTNCNNLKTTHSCQNLIFVVV